MFVNACRKFPSGNMMIEIFIVPALVLEMNHPGFQKITDERIIY
jgi:hypothetical protein